MRRTLMKSKIHRATVTDANLDYQGSVTIDPVLLELADILPYERVEIYNVTNGERFATYAIQGAPGRGEICLNGAAAHKVRPGHLVILATYAEMEEAEARTWHPKVVFVDERNRPIGHPSSGTDRAPGDPPLEPSERLLDEPCLAPVG